MHNILHLFSVLISLLLISGCSAQKLPEQTLNAENIDVSWSLVENNYQGKSQNLSRFVIKNNGLQTFPADNWKMYFSFIRPIKSSRTPRVRFSHISGDFFKMEPTASFPSVAPGDSVVIEFTSSYSVLNISDAPAGLYFTFAKNRIEKPARYTVLPFPEEKHITRGEHDHTPVSTPEHIFHQNRSLSTLNKEHLIPIIPEPVSYQEGTGSINLTGSSYRLRYDSALTTEAAYLKDSFKTFGLILSDARKTYDGKVIELTRRTDSDKPESYTLNILQNGDIQISGADPAGVFYGIQSLLSLISPNELNRKGGAVSLPVTTIRDYPRFKHRGMFLDVSRNFQSKETVFRLLDLMSRYKLNKFHIHLADDEGWRIEIPGLPELTEVGSRRGHTLEEKEMLHPSYGSGPFVDAPDNNGTGFYSVKDYIDILHYAADRHIEVIPEVDVPGHARAAIKSMLVRYHRQIEQGKEEAARQYLLTDPGDKSVYTSVQNYDDNTINPCRTSTYNFLEKVIDEIKLMYEQADVPLSTFHIGGDEVPLGVWTKAPSCQKQFPGLSAEEMKEEAYTYFVETLSTIIESKGLSVGGWEDAGVRIQNGKHLPNRDLAKKDIVLNTWNSIWGGNSEDLAYRLANAGYDVILSNASNLYFDMAVNKHPQEPGFYWAAFADTKNVFEFTPMDIFKSAYVSLTGDTLSDSQWEDKVRLTADGRQNIRGIQAQLWSETVRGPDRMEYMIFPRLLALAQRAWSPQPGFATIQDRQQRENARDEAWNVFANVLGQHALPRLDNYPDGINYNIPAPGAVIDGQNRLHANVAYPGLTIRYTTDGSEPGHNSPVYTGPVKVPGTVKLKTFTDSGRGSRTVQVSP